MKNEYQGHDPLNGHTPEENFEALNSNNFFDFQDKFTQETTNPVAKSTPYINNSSVITGPQAKNHSMDGAEVALERTENLTDELRGQKEMYEGLMNKNWSLGEQLMNRSMFKQVQSMKKEMLATTSKRRLQVYDTILQARLDFIREHCNAALTVVKSKYRLEVAKAFTEHLEELYRTIIRRRSSFVQMTLAECNDADIIPNLRVRAKINNSIVKGEDLYIDMLDNLLIHYSNILKGLIDRD
ncbi:MAG: hypothetical protein JJE55_12595 [Flavobacteriaceae bacterium]|nr:hypothetical protein [Flavobacteriaceae bacterium]